MNRLAAMIAAALLLSGCGAPGNGDAVDVKDQDAVNQLPIPAVVQGDRIALTAQMGSTDFGQGAQAPTIGLNGNYLGPTLRLTRGQKVRVDVTNDLDEMTTLHWHGMHVPAKMDGGPHSMIQAGQTWSPHWTVDQPAATLWYHSHPHGETAQQVYRGLAGMILLEDPQAPEVGLPDTYGVDDIPLVVQDKSFTSDGQLVIDPAKGPSTGFLGDTIVTNGKLGSYLPVTTQAVRLRLLNASNARFYNFGFSDGREFATVASDGGLLPAPVIQDRVQLAPGERAEIVVRLAQGETVTLNSTPPNLDTTNDALYSGGTFDILELRAAPTLTPSPELAGTLTTLPTPDQAAASTTRTFAVQGRAINGRPMDMHRIDFAVPVDQTEVWEVSNRDPQPHNFHVHNVQFRVLSEEGRPPAAERAGFKDTVYVPPWTTTRILVKFTEYTDRNWPYMFHCHLLLHEDIGVMGQFVVVKPGQEPGMPPMTDHMAMD
jgi:FtsP/CotA-like multicopper oxidase with cupredoxin domain